MINTNEIQHITYEEILQRFIDPEYIDWKKHPFVAFDGVCATNGWSLVYIPEKLPQLQLYDFTYKLKNIFNPEQKTPSLSISLKTLTEKMESFPMVDCYDEVESNCTACDGTGIVESEFYHNGKNHPIESDCPICDGSGMEIIQSTIPNGQKEYDPEHTLRIYGFDFHPKRIMDLIWTAEKLLCHEIGMIQILEPKHAKFILGNVQLIISPIEIYGAKQMIAQEIP